MKHEYHEGPKAADRFEKAAMQVFRAFKSSAKAVFEEQEQVVPLWQSSGAG